MPANVIQTAIVQRARARIHFNWAIVWRRRQRKSAAQRILLKTLRPIVVAQAWSSRAIIHQKSWFFDRKQHLHIYLLLPLTQRERGKRRSHALQITQPKRFQMEHLNCKMCWLRFGEWLSGESSEVWMKRILSNFQKVSLTRRNRFSLGRARRFFCFISNLLFLLFCYSFYAKSRTNLISI